MIRLGLTGLGLIRGISILAVVPCISAICLGFTKGTGQADDPYWIATREDLLAIGSDPRLLDRHFVLVADIDLDPNIPEGVVFTASLIRGPFTGTFDGAGHMIRNMVIMATGTSTDFVGLFGRIGPAGIVRNLGIEACDITGSNHVGALSGVNEGKVIWCYATGSVNRGRYVGGLIGANKGLVQLCGTELIAGRYGSSQIVGGLVGANEGMILDCLARGQVYGVYGVGGLVGANLGQIESSYAMAYVYGSAGSQYVAGLVGINTGYIYDSQASGYVEGSYGVGGIAGSDSWYIEGSWWAGDVYGDMSVGGLVGIGFGKVISSKATGHVYGRQDVGGLVGYSQGHIRSCYSVATVTGDSSVGGLVGKQFDGVVVTSYSAGQVSGKMDVGGLIGYMYEGGVYLSYWDRDSSCQQASAAGRGRSTSQMRSIKTYLGWSDGSWVIDEGRGYPRLVWEGSKGSPIVDEPIAYAAGDGSPLNPYRIDTADQLIQLGYIWQDWGKSFVLAKDLDLGGIDPDQIWPIGAVDRPFRGIFDGNGHAIEGLRITGPGNYQGLFGVLDGDSLISRLTLKDSQVIGNRYVGMLVGYSQGRLRCCQVTGQVIGIDIVGGLVGQNSGHIQSCSSDDIVVDGLRFTGGLVGVSHGDLDRCKAQGDITGMDLTVGGLVGANMGCIRQSYADCNLTGDGSYAGGLVGVNWGWVLDSYSQGMNLCLGDHIGGLIGSVESGKIQRCYSAVGIPGLRAYVGGLVGRSYDPDGIVSCFWDKDSSSQAFSYGGEGLDRLEMTRWIIFVEAGWDLIGEQANGTEDIWLVEDGLDYPRLWWQQMPGE